MRGYATGLFNIQFFLRGFMKKVLLYLVLSLWAGTVWSAPVVVVPGDSAIYMYFPEEGATAAVPAATSTTVEPVGFIGMFPKAPPAGWLECDGSAVTAVDHPELVAHLTGNPAAASAVLPDFRGEFIRGWDHGRGLDAGRALWSGQGQSNLSHTHTTSGLSSAGAHTHSVSLGAIGNHVHQISGTRFINPNFDDDVVNRSGSSQLVNGPATTVNGGHSHAIATSSDPAHAHTLSVGADGGTEARPRNRTIIFAIKAE